MTDPVERIPAGVRIEATRYCAVAVSGLDEREVLDQLAGWTREHYHDIEIVGLQWTTEWTPDPSTEGNGDQLLNYIVTMQFKTGAQQDRDWGLTQAPTSRTAEVSARAPDQARSSGTPA